MINGIENLGNTCYINCILQLIMQCTDIIKCCIENEKYSSSLILSVFNEFIKDYYKNNNIATAHKIQKVVQTKNLFLPYQQYDAHEFLTYFLDILSEESKKLYPLNINNFFQYKYYTIFMNQKNRNIERKMSNGEYILTLPFSSSLIESLQNFEIKDMIDNWENDAKEKICIDKYNEIYHWPNYLFIQINRYDSKFNKIQDSMIVPLKFNDYELKGAVIHHGQYNFGHYICIIYQNNEFFICDDDKIQKISFQDATNLIDKSYLLLYNKISSSKN